MKPLIQRKHASLRSCYPRADICLLMEPNGLAAFMEDAEKIHAVIPQLQMKNYGDPDSLDDAFVCVIPQLEALKYLAAITVKYSVALCEWVTDHGYVAFSFHSRQPGAVPSQPPAVQEMEIEEDFI